jgi:hypothetical protein
MALMDTINSISFVEALIVVSVQYQALIILAKAVVLMPNLFLMY